MTNENSTGPTTPTERIQSLDVLRGFAILGILLINIQLFAYPDAVGTNPTVYGDFTGINYGVWAFMYIFADSKFLTIFTVLFGTSIALFTEKKAAGGRNAILLHYRRMFWLLVIGLLHAYLLWGGDILVPYALSAGVVVWARKWTAINQLLLGVGVASVAVLHELSFAVEGTTSIVGGWTVSEPALQAEIAAFQSDWLTQVMFRANDVFLSQTVGFIAWKFWRVAGLMLVGMALYNSGFITGSYSQSAYKRVIAVTAPLGIGLTTAGILFIEANAWSADVALYWRSFNYWGSILLGTAYIALVTLYASTTATSAIQRGLAVIGRTALSNYILQSVIATWIFYGHGLGLFGTMSRVEQLGVVVVIWTIQVIVSVLWLRWFQYGPLEWAWRSLTYHSVQPLRR